MGWCSNFVHKQSYHDHCLNNMQLGRCFLQLAQILVIPAQKGLTLTAQLEKDVKTGRGQ
jgi:hypothetical protein